MKKEIKKKLKSEVREFIEAALFAAFIALCIIRPFIVQTFKIPTGSMRTTLIEKDLIIVNKFIYGGKIPFTDWRMPGLRQPQRGDVIVFIYPEDQRKFFIKRLIGLPGETVEIKNGSVYINDAPLSDSVFNKIYYYNKGDNAKEGQKIVVPPDSYFVLGDNSASSLDSRFWGFVPKNNVLGKAFFIYWPPQRMRVIH
ncbi:MAG: signal peptidase I [Candidatus Omnitrophica bacterium]|nr:signal peptidase I [Candidatus Omnitrophota bacterium]